MFARPTLWLLTLAALSGGVPSLRAQEDRPTPAQLDFFERRIRPLLVNHCYACHSHDAKKVKGELYLDTRTGLRKGGASGPAFVRGEPEKSLLIEAVRYDTELRMPPKGKLTQAEIDDLVAWVKMGAPDPRDDKSGTVKSGS